MFLKQCIPSHRLTIAFSGIRSQQTMRTTWPWVSDNSNRKYFSPIPVKLRVIAPDKYQVAPIRQPCVEEFKMPPSVNVARYTKTSGDADSGSTKESSPANENFEGSFIGSYIEAFKKRFKSEEVVPGEKSVHSSEIKNETPSPSNKPK